MNYLELRKGVLPNMHSLKLSDFRITYISICFHVSFNKFSLLYTIANATKQIFIYHYLI